MNLQLESGFESESSIFDQIENTYNMNESNPSARLAQKLFGLASKKYGAPYCGSPLIDDALSQGVRFWVSGIAVGGVGIPGM